MLVVGIINQNTKKLEIGLIDKDKSYEMKRDIIGGLLEAVHLPEEIEKRNITMYVNEEGKLLQDSNLPTVVLSKDENILDILFGNVVIVKYDYSEGQEYSLTIEDINFLENYLYKKQTILTLNQKQLILPMIEY